MGLSTDDIVAINQLYSRYNHSIDCGDGESFAACFTTDGELDTGSGAQEGSEAIAGFAVGTHEMLPGLRHQSNNIVVEGDGETASGAAFLVAFTVDGGYKPMITGKYTDELVRTDAGWRFSRRSFVADA